MKSWSRRQWLGGIAAGFAGAGGSFKQGVAGQKPSMSGGGNEPQPGRPRGLLLSEYRPKSMLQVPQHRVPRARFPLIDVHTHPTVVAQEKNGVEIGQEIKIAATPEELLPIMDRKNVRTMVDLTGGWGTGLEKAVATFHTPHPDRFLVFTEPAWEKITDPGYPKIQADLIERAHRGGARGLKILKILGLYLRENVTSGPLVKVDDPRFDPMWEACGQLGIPVSIHVSDPVAFFLPPDRFNERYEELQAHPDWSFYGRDFPSKLSILEARNRVIARHPNTHFIGLHVGNYPEDLAVVSAWLDRYPNLSVGIAARIAELGRQPRTARKFFEKYQDRIMVGTDMALSHWRASWVEEIYETYFRFLETEDEYFDYADVPSQGRWKIYGLGLPDEILRKVYFENAARLLKIPA